MTLKVPTAACLDSRFEGKVNIRALLAVDGFIQQHHCCAGCLSF